ncbi:MAG TPA: hypothetical protein VFY69_02140 [Solirubrobacterales bacterium]|nr:hypothetical protein [Solirubrobacterales bacterium]
MPPFARGVIAAVGSMVGGSTAVALLLIGSEADFVLSDEALAAMAQIGATLLIAYAVETSWFVKESRSRGRERENWLGFVTGVGACGALGTAIAIAFIGHDGSLSFLQAFAGMWMLFSIGLLALLVAFLPYLLYELVHALNTEYPDE